MTGSGIGGGLGFVQQYGNYPKVMKSGRVGHIKTIGPSKGLQGLGFMSTGDSTIDLSNYFDWITGDSAVGIPNNNGDSVMTINFPWLTTSATGSPTQSGTNNPVVASGGIGQWISQNKGLLLMGVALGFGILVLKRR